MARRTKAREAAFQVIYQNDLNPRNDPDADVPLRSFHTDTSARARWRVDRSARDHVPPIMAIELFTRLCALFGKACALLALLFIDEVEALCVDVFADGWGFLDRCRSDLRQARSRWLWGARGLQTPA